jgi:hypothetical protein
VELAPCRIYFYKAQIGILTLVFAEEEASNKMGSKVLPILFDASSNAFMILLLRLAWHHKCRHAFSR